MQFIGAELSVVCTLLLMPGCYRRSGFRCQYRIAAATSLACSRSLSNMQTRTSTSNAQGSLQPWRPGNGLPFPHRFLLLGNIGFHDAIAQRRCCLIFPSAGSPTQAEEAAQRLIPFTGQPWLLLKCSPTRALPATQALLTSEHEWTPLELQLAPTATPWTWHVWAGHKSCGATSSLCLSLD
jgi:hypothetical protein